MLIAEIANEIFDSHLPVHVASQQKSRICAATSQANFALKVQSNSRSSVRSGFEVRHRARPIGSESGEVRVYGPKSPRESPSEVGPAMPRYFFNTRIGDELIADPEGEELRNPDRAWKVARAMIRELFKTEGTEGGLLHAVLEVTDDAGEIVLEFPFAEALLDVEDLPATRH